MPSPTMRLYVNGEVVRSDDKQSPGVTAHRSGNWKVGWDEDGSSRRFNGVLDDVRIHDRALSDREVRDLYEATEMGRQ